MWTRTACLLLTALAASGPAVAQTTMERFQSGVHYFPIQPAQAVARDGAVEVLEVFSYACPACVLIEPKVEAWKRRQPAHVRFDYLPATWSAAWEAAGRAYYAAEALGVRERTHMPLYEAMHVDRRRLDTLEGLADWYATQGTPREDFLAAARSFAVNAKVRRGEQQLPRYGIDSTPSFIVAGKYRVTGASAGSHDAVFDVIDFLVAREAAALAVRSSAP